MRKVEISKQKSKTSFTKLSKVRANKSTSSLQSVKKSKVKVVKEPEPVIQSNQLLDPFIQLNGSNFLCACYVGGIKQVNEINDLFKRLKENEIIDEKFSVKDWQLLAESVGGKNLMNVNKDEACQGNEKEILFYQLSLKESYYVVGDGKANIVYDPKNTSVKYSECKLK